MGCAKAGEGKSQDDAAHPSRSNNHDAEAARPGRTTRGSCGSSALRLSPRVTMRAYWWPLR